MFDALCIDYQFETPEQLFEVNIFNTVIDIVTNQIESRFTSLTSYFSFLNPKNIILLDSDEIFKHATNLQNNYPINITDAFPNQMILFKKTFKTEIKDVENIPD